MFNFKRKHARWITRFIDRSKIDFIQRSKTLKRISFKQF